SCVFCPAMFFFSSRSRHTRFSRDWSSDVCSSDLMDDELLGQPLNGCRTLLFAGLSDRCKGGPAEAVDAQEAGTEGLLLLAGEPCRIDTVEQESAGHRPFSRLRRASIHKGIGRIEPDRPWQLYSHGAPVAGSSQDGAESASLRLRRSIGCRLAPRKCRRSPLSASRVRRSPFRGQRSSQRLATGGKPASAHS